LALINAASIKSYIPFSPQVSGGLVLYFSFTSLAIVFGLLFEPLHSGLFSSFSITSYSDEDSNSPAFWSVAELPSGAAPCWAFFFISLARLSQS
jgi:hypothetical protein